MRRYELALVASCEIPEPEHDKLITAFEELIAQQGGVVHKVDRWGRRKLAYPIRKLNEGNYTFILFDAEPEVERELLRRLRLSDKFLRFLIVRADHERIPTEEEKEALVLQRAEIIRKAEERAQREAEEALRGDQAGEAEDVEETGDDEDEDELDVEELGDEPVAAPDVAEDSAAEDDAAGETASEPVGTEEEETP